MEGINPFLFVGLLCSFYPVPGTSTEGHSVRSREPRLHYERAAEWLEKAARAGHAGAMAHLGSLYYAGYGVPQSFERAVGLFKQGVAQGNPVR